MFGWLRRKETDAAVEFVEYLRKHRPDLKVASVTPDTITIGGRGSGDLSVNADRIRETVAQGKGSRRHRDKTFAQFAAVIDECSAASRPLSLAKDRSRLRPRLVSKSFYQAASLKNPPIMRLLEPLGLPLLYALDSPNSVAFLYPNGLAELGIDEGSVFEIAMENLRSPSFQEIVRSVVTERKAVRVCTMDSYDAARMLLIPEILETREAVAACIPDRDSLFICPEPADWSSLLEIARTPASDRLILDRPVRITRMGFELK